MSAGFTPAGVNETNSSPNDLVDNGSIEDFILSGSDHAHTSCCRELLGRSPGHEFSLQQYAFKSDVELNTLISDEIVNVSKKNPTLNLCSAL